MAFLDENGLAYYHGKIDDIFAHKDGSYESMTVGNAEQLVSTVGIEDKTPYNFRTSGGTVDIGDREQVNAVVGGTVAWNQLVSSSATSVAIPNGHKYVSYIGGSWSAGESTGADIAVDGANGDKVFDITLALGMTVANYAYSLGSAACVSYFLKLFQNAKNASYNSGELLSVNTSQHKMVGFNQFDKSAVTVGKKVSTNGAISADARIDLSDYIKCIPNMTYYFKDYANLSKYVGVAYFDADKNFISYGGSTGATSSDENASGLKVTPSDCYYMRVNIPVAFLDSACVNLSWDGERDGEYEPYKELVYPLDSTLTLRGIPKLDANNNLYYDGDTYESDGTVTRKYGTRAYASGDESLADAITDGTTTVYKLATPTTETAEPYTQTQSVDDFGTEEYTDAAVASGTRDVAIPVGHDTFYQNNLRAKLEMAPDSPDGNGDYIVRQTNGLNEYVAVTDNPTISGLATRCPACPTDTDGNFVLKAVVSSGSVTYSWVAEA